MRELKILLLILVIIAVTYFGIEPLAHYVMNPSMEKADFKFTDLKESVSQGDVKTGKQLALAYCTGCHSINRENVPLPVTKDILILQYGSQSKVDKNFEKLANKYLSDIYGVVPLDLSDIATIYDEKFLKSFIKDPSNASFESTYNLHRIKKMHLDMVKATTKKERAKIEKIAKKDIETFKNKNKISMPNLGIDDKTADHLVAYFKSISKPLNPKQSTILACGRCHSASYDNVVATTSKPILNKYLGKIPPDLSMFARSRGVEYLDVFINDPQKVLIGTSMPRVGLNKLTQDKILSYLDNISDLKKEERKSLGIWVILYLVIFTILAYLWKRKIWKDIK